jgi:hypothetical protein
MKYQIKILFIIVSSLCFLPSCSGQENQSSDESGIYDLIESTEIIMRLIKEDRLKEILVNEDPDLNILLYNFSPAQMALKVEVLNAECPSILV